MHCKDIVTMSRLFMRCVAAAALMLCLWQLNCMADDAPLPQVLNGELDQWSNGRLAGWTYVPYSALEIQKSQEIYNGHPVITMHHPKLGFLEQVFADGSTLMPGDILSVSVSLRSQPGATVDLSFMLLYGKGDDLQRKYKKEIYTGGGEWQRLEVLWVVSEADLENLEKVVIRLSVANAEAPVSVSHFQAYAANVGVSANPIPPGSVEVAWIRP